MSKHRIRHPAIAVLAARLFCRPAVTPGVARSGADGIGYTYSIDPLFKEFVDFLSSDFEETSMSVGQSNHIVVRNKHLMFYLPTPLRGFTTSLRGFFSGPEHVLSANRIMRAHDYMGSGSVGRGALGNDEKGFDPDAKNSRMWRQGTPDGASLARRQYRDNYPAVIESAEIDKDAWDHVHGLSRVDDNTGVHRDEGRGKIDLSAIPVVGWIAMGMMAAATPQKRILARPRQSWMGGYNDGHYKRIKSASQEWIEAQGWNELMPMIYADRAFIIEWFELCAQLGVQTKGMSSAEMDWLRDIIGGGQWEKAVTVNIDTSGWPV